MKAGPVTYFPGLDESHRVHHQWTTAKVNVPRARPCSRPSHEALDSRRPATIGRRRRGSPVNDRVFSGGVRPEKS